MSNEWSLLLKKAGLKATSARKHILKAFSSDCKPINAEYLYSKLKAKKINQVTIYRTLASMEIAGILKRVDLRKDSIYYELALNHHHHIVCTNCGKTEVFDICGIDTISQKILKKSSKFKTISQHSLELFGMCRTCTK